MTQAALAEKVAVLERQVAELKAKVARLAQPRAKDWRRTIGMFTGDDGMRELFAEAQKLREADRARARRKPTKPKSRKVGFGVITEVMT